MIMNKNNALKIVLGIYALCVLILLIYSSIIGFESSGDLFSMGQLILEASLIPIAVYGFTYAVEEFKKSLERPELSLLFLDDSGNESKKITLSSDLPEHNNIEEYPRFKIPIYLKNSGDIVAIWYSIRLSIPLELLGTLHTEILNSKSLIRKLGFDNKLGSTQNWSSNESDGILDVRFESKGEIASYPDQELLLGVIDFSVSPNDNKYGGKFPLRYTIYTDKGISRISYLDIKHYFIDYSSS